MSTTYESPELVDLGEIEEVTLGADVVNVDDHCECDRVPEFWLF